jgi:putative restriction endonuclease
VSARSGQDDRVAGEPNERLLSLRLHQKDGRRSPHKPLLALLAIGNLLSTGSSALPWSDAEQRLAGLLAEFGPASSTSPPQSAAYPFTRLRSDGVWLLDAEVPMDSVGPLRAAAVTGRFEPALEAELLASPVRAYATARLLVSSHFPESLVSDVLLAAGLDPELTLGGAPVPTAEARRRSAAWRLSVIEAWDRQCAFCGYDGQLAGASVGLDAAHVRWFAFDGPDELDNGLTLCSLHHKLFDRGVLGLGVDRVLVSGAFTARTETGRRVYDLHDRPLRPRPGTPLPQQAHVRWHTTEVFKGLPLAV